MFTLLVYEQVPEDTKLYLIPNHVIDNGNYWDLMKQAHNKFINNDEENQGMRFINLALVDEENKDDDQYFDDAYVNMPDGTRKRTRDDAPREWRCIFAKYKQEDNTVIENVTITRVVVTGFIL